MGKILGACRAVNPVNVAYRPHSVAACAPESFMVHCLDDLSTSLGTRTSGPRSRSFLICRLPWNCFPKLGKDHLQQALQQSTATSTTLHSLTFTQSGKVVLRCALHGCGCLRVSRRQLRWAGEKAGVAPHLRISSFWKTFIAQLRQMGT